MDWSLIKNSLDERGFARVSGVLARPDCLRLQSMYGDPSLYRSVISMERYRFGRGEYKYFSYPLPGTVQEIREKFYVPLSEVANGWMERLDIDVRFPAEHAQFIGRCHEKDQRRPTPLILRYGEGGYNTLHQDLYGEVYFPFQVVFALGQEGDDYEGGEFVLVEQVPRAQSRAEVLRPDQGDALIFTTNFRPVKGTRGYYRASMKHGISEVKKGVRFALGIIFHDAA